MKTKISTKYLLILLLLIVTFAFFIIERKNDRISNPTIEVLAGQTVDVSVLTNQNKVIGYLRQNQKLPAYYLTKNEARKLGWKPEEGNLCKVLPGRAIGGDFFGNREGKLPKKNNRKYFEADINYNCGHRDQQRLIYSNDGLIFITTDHYKTFKKQ